jgi:hypothetical protein
MVNWLSSFESCDEKILSLKTLDFQKLIDVGTFFE